MTVARVFTDVVKADKFFAEMTRLVSSRQFVTVADALNSFAEAGALRCVEVGDLMCNSAWFGHEVMQTALTSHHSSVGDGGSEGRSDSPGAAPRANPAVTSAQPAHITAALSLLFQGVLDLATGSRSPVYGSAPARASTTMPLYDLGQAIGAGTNGVVHHATGKGATTTRLRVGLGGDGGHARSRDSLPSCGGVSGSAAGAPPSRPEKPGYSPDAGTERGGASEPGGGSFRARGDAEAQEQASVAVKVVRKGQSGIQKVMWEIHVLRNLTGHPHIVRLIDVIDVVDSCYMIMERIEGPDLSRLISDQPAGVLPEPVAQTVFCQLLAALRHAHGAGFVHCDVKPENVRMLRSTIDLGSIHAVLLDWGYARRIGYQSEPITQGTPAYAAPEQLCGYQADGISARSCLSATVDAWSLGATLCEMLAGAPPFGGELRPPLPRPPPASPHRRVAACAHARLQVGTWPTSAGTRDPPAGMSQGATSSSSCKTCLPSTLWPLRGRCAGRRAT